MIKNNSEDNRLDNGEVEILDAFNKCKLDQIENSNEEIASTIKSTKNHLKKDTSINIRLNYIKNIYK